VGGVPCSPLRDCAPKPPPSDNSNRRGPVQRAQVYLEVPSILKLSAISRPHFHKGLHKVRPTVRDDLFPLIVIHELEFLRKDDVLVVTRLDRLARSMLNLQNIIKTLRDKGAWLRCTEQPIDMTTASGKAFLDMLGVFAEFENNLRCERQLEGIAKAKAAGVYT
jgi:hypothetical protein